MQSTERVEFLNDPQNFTGYSQVIRETHRDGSGELTKEVTYTFGLDELSQTTVTFENGQASSPTTVTFAHDGHGSVRALLDAAGAIATLAGHPGASAIRQLFTYDAYGNAVGFNMSAAATVLLYSGEQFDQRVQMQYLRARFYDAANGRFVGLDPYFGNSSDPQSFHKYLYTHGNPIGGTDPSGMMSLVGLGWSMAIGAMIGGLSTIGANYALNRPPTENLGWGIGIGALAGPLAYAFPFIGAGLSLWGIISSLKMVYTVYGDVNSTHGQKTAAMALLGLALFGGYASGKHIKANGFWRNNNLFGPSKSVEVSPTESTAQPQPEIPSIARQPIDVAHQTANPTPPAASQSGSIGTPNQNAALAKFLKVIERLQAEDIRVNQEQVNAAGVRVGKNKPDLQFTLKGRRWYIEWDTSNSNRGIPHAQRTLANDPDGQTLLFRHD